MLDVYQRVWDGQPLGPNDFVICSDEKPSIQARGRCQPTRPPGKTRTMRVDHDYQRHGALTYLAAYDVHQAKIVGRCEDSTGIVPFTNLVAQVMTRALQIGGPGVWIVDNGSSHRGQAAVDRLAGQFSNARVMVHIPVHASG